MSNSQDLSACMTNILAIPADQVLEPSMPVDSFVQESENLYQWSKDDLILLAAAGITAEKLEELNVRAGACREAQSLWVKDRRLVKDAQKLWDEQSPAAYELRNKLLHTFRYAFRNNDGLLGRVSEITEGHGHDDMIQDLNDLAVLGQENLALLEAIGFDTVVLETAATMASDLADLLATANGEKKSGNEAKVLRDRAYTYLKELVDQVRACGKYLFWKDKDRLQGYLSDYWRKKKRKSGTK